MKKLSIEEKAKRYDEAVKAAESLCKITTSLPMKEYMESIFPELKEESEDERMKKVAIEFVKQNSSFTYLLGISKEEVIAWLEKQGEHTKFRDSIQIGDQVTRNQDGVLVNLSQLKRVAKPADKVEPKFKIGDWVVNRFGDVWHIDSFDSKNYQVSNGDKYCYFPIEKQDEMHLWTIQDVRDGDVLVCEDFGYTSLMLFESFSNGRISLYCWHNSQTNNFHINTDVVLRKDANIYPATKKQRDTLLKVMADAGYTFDFEKKELKKIEQKPAWSEDDDNCLSTIIAEFSKCSGKSVSKDKWMRCNDFLNSLRDRVVPQPKQEWSDEDESHVKSILLAIEYCKAQFSNAQAAVEAYNADIDWLKSLRPQSHWKPSNEQIIALRWVLNNVPYNKHKEEISGLLDQIKEL